MSKKLIERLVKTANALDESGLFDMGNQVDQILEKVAAKKGKTKEGWPKKLKKGRFTEQAEWF